MADKLSVRLDDAWRKLYADGDEHDVCDTIAEAAELARRVEGAEDGIADVLHKLDSWCEAYPESVFPEPTPEQIKQVNGAYAGAVTRISASMGRHMVKHMREMADAVRRLVPEPPEAA